jgi:glycine cleavage system H protein
MKEIIAVVSTIHYYDYQIDVHMPVQGKIIEFNETLPGSQNLLINKPMLSGWIALIAPSNPFERKELLQPFQYEYYTKRKL